MSNRIFQKKAASLGVAFFLQSKRFLTTISNMKKIILSIALFLPFLSMAQVEQANLLGQWSNDDEIVVVGWLQSRYNEVWGVAVNDSEVGIIGSTMGAHFIDVTDPTNPTEIELIEGMAVGTNLVHRDYHDYNGYLFAVADEGGSSGLEIIDLSGIPNSVERIYADNEFIRTSHNIFIDEDNARLYSIAGVRGNGSNYAVLILDISEPTNPQFLAQYSNSQMTVGGTHDLYVKDNIAYINGGDSGLRIVDFTDATAPVVMGSLTEYPQSGYNHAGWLNEEGRYYYMLDETQGTDIKALDVCDAEDIQVVKTFDAEAPATTSIPHNAIVHCNRLYVSYYYEGLQIYDIDDPANPERIYEYDTYPGADEDFFAGAWGVYPLLPSGNILVSDLQTGLYVFEAIEDDCSYDVLADCDASNDVSSVDEVENLTEISIFPQPTNGKLTISFTAVEGGKADFILQDLSGKNVQTSTGNTISAGTNAFNFDLQNAASGMYFLTVQGENWSEVMKVVVQ